jgi:hypothetical protein
MKESQVFCEKFWKIYEGNVKELSPSDACELGFQHMTYTYVTKQKRDEVGG